MKRIIRGALVYVEAKNVKAITEILNIAEKLGLEISSMQFHKYEDIYSLLLTLERDINIVKFVKDAGTVGGVERVKLLAELPVTQVRPIFTTMLRRIIEAFNGAAMVFMYHAGLVVGHLLREIFPKLPNEEVIERALLLMKGSGLGMGSLTRYSSHNRCVIEIRDSFECSNLRSDKPMGYFIKGVITGLLSELWSVKVKVSEVKCVALGDKYCEFLAVPSSKKM